MGGASSNTFTQGGLPAWGQQPYRNTVQGWGQAQGQLPSIGSLYNNMPMLNVPNLTGQQTSLINQAYGRAMNPGPNPTEAAGLASIADANLNLPTLGLSPDQLAEFNQFMPGASGVSAATKAAQDEFKKLQLPTIENVAANMGQANSGALLEAASTGEAQVMTPLLEQQNQLALGATEGKLSDVLSSQGLQLSGAEAQAQQKLAQGQAQFGAGGEIFNQNVTNLTNALQAAGLPYEVAAQKAQAQFNQQQGQSQLGQEIQMGPMQAFPSIFGTQNSLTTTTSPKF